MYTMPATWHYGLVARWWAEFNFATPDELRFYADFVARDRPGLDLACGAGRLLLPLVQAGFDVDGCDVSADMLGHCRDQAERMGVPVTLYEQPMHELDIPRSYGTIFICDSWGLGATREDDREALARCYRHLAPGGALVISHYLPYGSTSQWLYWLAEGRETLPQDWPEAPLERTAANGDQFELGSRLLAFDPVEQQAVRQVRVRLSRSGQTVAEEEHLLTENLYFRHELLLMLELAGFSQVAVQAAYTGEPAGPEDNKVVFVARK